MIGELVADMTAELTEALRATESDGVDRRLALVRSVLAIVGDTNSSWAGRL
jgi:hypothetical protein